MSESITQTIDRITAFIQANAPGVDIAPGSVFNELLVNLDAKIQNQLFSDIDDISSLQSVQAALTSLGDTFSPVIDAIASNYNATRIQGTPSSGVIQVFVPAPASYSIPTGVLFTQPTLGYVYATSAATSVTTTGNGGTQKIKFLNGLYYFTVPVASQIVGKLTAISNGTQFILNNPPQIPGFIKALALGSFISGINTETDKELIARFRKSMSVNNLLSEESISSLLQSLYPNFRDVFLADSTSPINTRSLSNPLGMKIPGCVDVWVKDGVTIPHITFSKTGTDNHNNTWSVGIPAAAAPGFYRIVNVADASASPQVYFPFTITYGYAGSASNLLNSAADARFSVYQTATLTVNTTGYTPSGTFNVTALASPNLPAIQALFLDETRRIPCADYLVKGIVPCQVSMNISLVKNYQGDVIDVAGLQSDIFNYVNSLASGEPLAASKIVNLCHNYGIARVDLPMVLNGTILTPDVNDTNLIISGTDFLQIPNLPEKGVIPQNTMFFINYVNESGSQNINISIN